jgi:ATP-dependent DNA ligase
MVLQPPDAESLRPSERSRRASRRIPTRLVYYAFDLLHVDGRDLMPLPLVQRKEVLESLLSARQLTREGLDWTVRFHPIADALARLKALNQRDGPPGSP